MVRIYKIQFDSWVQQCGCNFFTNFACCFLRACYFSPCGRGVKYAYRLPACCMRGLKRCPDGSASTACDYASLLYNLYRDAGPKHCHYSQTSRAKSPLNPFYTWCNMLLTGLHHSPVVSTLLLFLPSNSSILPLHLVPLFLPHTEKYFRNLIKLIRNQIIFTLFD